MQQRMIEARSLRLSVAIAVLIFLCAHLPCDAGDDLPQVNTQGKDQKWMGATEKFRGLLSKLNARDAKVKRWLPSIQRRCEVLNKLKSMTAVEQKTFGLQSEVMLEDILAGTSPLARYAGKIMFWSYYSDTLKRLVGMRIFVPVGYDAKNNAGTLD